MNGTTVRTVMLGGQRYVYTIRRSRKARRIAIHIDVWRGIEVVMPWRGSVNAADKFVWEMKSWLEKRVVRHERLRASVPRRSFGAGESLPLLGEELVLQVNIESGRKRNFVRREGNELVVFVSGQEDVRTALVRWYRQRAREYFTDLTQDLARHGGVVIKKVAIGEQRTQWGSCGDKGQLSFNWRLMLAPVEVARYVAVHEVMHLCQHNHSPAFWQLVAEADPDWKEHKRWLNRNEYRLVL
ncbi:MAG: SprT family zinc-dependent metalloprotease [Candidatus Andersenbacteria bacterium]|nr:SprT family zinc-dependent metalloprotease [bacterium]MDZ4225393.1 SprT family zinc-dependent metalloprotease [Candidatus Andersenbacteria bacterium]